VPTSVASLAVRVARVGGLRSQPVSDGIALWERTLVARIGAGDDTALAIAYDQYGALVYGVAARLLGRDQAADVAQDVFTTLWDRPDGFDAAKGSLRTYLAVLARRRAIDHLRRHGRREANERRAHAAAPAAAPHVEEAAIALIAAERVRDALRRLPDAQRRAIELAYLDGLTFREVAVATGSSEGTAKSRIRLGLHRLAQELQTDGEVESA
jgi:RNA polymerase sigma factor (sigma-70 family)